MGNPDTATTTNTFVTGMGTKLGGIKSDMDRSAVMRHDAIVTGGVGSNSTAAITWYGYDAPQNLVEAGSRDQAEAAAPALDDFQRSLRVTHQGTHPSFNTVTSHSYGTVVTGQAAAHGNVLNADRVIFLASPGVTVRDIHDLHITGAAANDNGSHLFASTAMNDPIQLTKGSTLGMAPDQYGFGASEFKTPNASDSWWWDSDSHSIFWAQDESREKIATIIAGKTP